MRVATERMIRDILTAQRLLERWQASFQGVGSTGNPELDQLLSDTEAWLDSVR